STIHQRCRTETIIFQRRASMGRVELEADRLPHGLPPARPKLPFGQLIQVPSTSARRQTRGPSTTNHSPIPIRSRVPGEHRLRPTLHQGLNRSLTDLGSWPSVLSDGHWSCTLGETPGKGGSRSPELTPCGSRSCNCEFL